MFFRVQSCTMQSMRSIPWSTWPKWQNDIRCSASRNCSLPWTTLHAVGTVNCAHCIGSLLLTEFNRTQNQFYWAPCTSCTSLHQWRHRYSCNFYMILCCQNPNPQPHRRIWLASFLSQSVKGLSGWTFSGLGLWNPIGFGSWSSNLWLNMFLDFE